MLALAIAPDHRPNTTSLLPFYDYDQIIVSFSGGKDSLALVLHLLDLGVPKHKIQLWHQAIDGDPHTRSIANGFMDWPCTEAYCKAVAKHLGIRLLFQWRHGGFETEMLKENDTIKPVSFELQDGTIATAGGLRGKVSTRLKFPQKSADLSVRWCSSSLKIDVAAMAINNEPTWKKGKKILFLSGERRQESTARSRYAEMEQHRCHTKSRRVDHWRAVIDWTEEQVWAIIARYRIKPHVAYRLGWGRVSCLACIFGLADQWASVRVIAPERFNRILAYEQKFGCTITKGLDVEQMANKGTPYPNCSDASLVALAMGTEYSEDEVFVPEGQEWEMPAGAFQHCGGPT